MAREVTDASFESDVLDESETQPIIVEFWAPWCGPSHELGPILTEALAATTVGITLARLNVTENTETPAAFGVQSIPFVAAIHKRQLVSSFAGLQDAESVRRFVSTLEARTAQPAGVAPSSEVPASTHGDSVPVGTDTLLAGSFAAIEAIAVGREALVAACTKRSADEKAYQQQLTELAEDYAARITAIRDYAKSLETRASTCGWFKGIDRARAEAKRPTTGSSPPGANLSIDASVSRGSGRPQGTVSGDAVGEADRALSAAEAASRKITGGMSKVLHRSTYVSQLSIVYAVAGDARDRAKQLETEQAAARSKIAQEQASTKARNDEVVQAAARYLELSATDRCNEYDALLASSPAAARPGWDPEAWAAWSTSSTVAPVYLGSLTAPPDRAQQEYEALPTNTVALTDDIRRLGGLLYKYTGPTRPAALSAARSLVARLLASIPPGKARFTFFDPLGLGEAVAPFLALADHDQTLIDGKVWSSVDGLRSRLAEHMNHIEVVIQKYLRGEYESIEDYNKEAGEIAEPYRFLFVYDYPSQFDEGTVHQLSRIIENGPRCGVFTVVLANADTTPPHGASINALPQLPTLAPDAPFSAFGQHPLTLTYDVDPIQALGAANGQAIIDRVVDLVGRSGRGADNVTVDLPKALRLYGETIRAGVRSDLPSDSMPVDIEDPSTWWTNTSVSAIAAPIGQSGARDVALLRFDSEILSGALLVGRPGAGKSTLLHSYVAGLCALYPPTELDLYLIDFKEGVEFKTYAETGLPHARCVAVESERDFGVSVLESIVAEMKHRAELIRATGGEQTSFSRLRASLDRPLPRIVLVFDEFHVLFSEDDKIGATAADHLETIIRQGRGFGVHVLLGSQSLAGLDALGRHVLQLLPIRLLLPSSESDAQLVLGDGNDAWRMLSRRGEGILNTSAGAVEANVPFQAAFESEESRLVRLKQLRHKADETGLSRCPIVFEGYGASDIAEHSPVDFCRTFDKYSAQTVPLRVGTPMSLAGPMDVELRREGGSNLLVVSRGSRDVPLGVVLSGLAAALTSPAHPRVDFVDFTSVDEGVEGAIHPLTDAGLLTMSRRRSAGRVIGGLAAETGRRIDEDDVLAPAVLLVLYGLHRARDLDANGTADPFEPDPDGDLLTSLRQILVNGPEVGIHTVAWVDSVSSLSRRIPRTLQREFGIVVAGAMSRDDSMDLIDSDAASSLRSHQIAVYNDDTGTVRRGRSFGIPSTDWLTSLCLVSQSDDR